MKISLFCVIIALAFVSHAQLAKPRPTATPIPVEGKSPLGYYTAGDRPGSYFHWTAESWTGDERPFIYIRRTIDAQVKSGKNPQLLLQEYRKAALSRPLDAHVQFRWAYTAFVIYENRWQSGKDESSALEGVREAMEKPKAPRSYEYTRVRLFVHQWDLDWSIRAMRSLRKCAFRLLKRNPQDDLIKYTFAFELSPTSNSVKEQDIAYKWAKEYLAKFPKKPQSYYLMGFVHNRRIDRTLSVRTVQEAISHLKLCQKMLPANHFYQKKVQKQIASVNEGVAIFRRAGKLKE